jgi:hypothetical protein
MSSLNIALEQVHALGFDAEVLKALQESMELFCKMYVDPSVCATQKGREVIPLGKGVLEKNVGIPIMFVCTGVS